MNAAGIRAAMLPLLALFLLTSLTFFHIGLKLHSGLEPSEGMQLLFNFGVAYLAALWVRSDYERSRYRPCFEYETLMLFLWPVLLPHYLIRTRGTAGLAIFGGLFALALVSALISTISAMVFGFYADTA